MSTFSEQLAINNSRLESRDKICTFRKGNIDFSCCFQHVIQRTYLDKELLIGDIAWYYHDQIVGRCQNYGVLPICQVVMPSHIHELYFCRNVVDISRMRSIACRNTTVFAKKQQRENGFKKVITRLFEREPGFVPIKDACQILTVLKYIRDNDLYLKAVGKKAPYSSFERWETKDYYKPFALDGLEPILGISVNELKQLLLQDKEKVYKVARSLKTNPAYFTIDDLDDHPQHM